jgi:thiamine pyrophosphokinase
LFHILARSTNGTDHRLKKKRGGERCFKTVDGAAQWLRQHGIHHIQLHLLPYAVGDQPQL